MPKTLHTKTCPKCNKEFTTRFKKQKYCSCKCSNSARTERSTVTFNCDQCGKLHTQPLSLYNKSKSGKHYCCDKCARLGKLVKRFKFNCPVCDKEFTRRECDLADQSGKKHKNLYCSRKCKTIGLSGGDEYSQFTYFMGGVRTRMIQNGTRDLLDFDRKYLKELWDAQGAKCAITNIPMTLDPVGREVRRTKSPYKASLDRIDSSKPYTKDNIQFVCMAVNYMKNEFGNEEIIQFLDSIERTLS